MRVIAHKVEVPVKGYTTFQANLYGCGDWHLGTANCAESMLDRTLEAIEKDPNGLFIGMGDYAECITPQDPRFDARSVDKYYLERLEDIAGAQFMEVRKKLKPLAEQGKIIGLLDGNHEDNIRKRHYRHLTMDLCRELNVPYLSYTSFIVLRFQVKGKTSSSYPSSAYTISAAHGWGAGRKKGSHINRIGDMLAWSDFDIALRGHIHRIITDTTTRLKISQSSKTPILYQDTPVLGYTGCYYRSYIAGQDCYAEKAEYPPSDLGCVVVHIKPFKKISIPKTEGDAGGRKRVVAGELTIERFIQ